MLHRIILNNAAARQSATICAIIVLFSYISTYEVELYINRNLLYGDDSLIFYRRYWILEWIVSFCGEELFGQIQCLNFSKCGQESSVDLCCTEDTLAKSVA